MHPTCHLHPPSLFPPLLYLNVQGVSAFTLKDAADRDRLGASTFKLINLGMAATLAQQVRFLGSVARVLLHGGDDDVMCVFMPCMCVCLHCCVSGPHQTLDTLPIAAHTTLSLTPHSTPSPLNSDPNNFRTLTGPTQPTEPNQPSLQAWYAYSLLPAGVAVRKELCYAFVGQNLLFLAVALAALLTAQKK